MAGRPSSYPFFSGDTLRANADFVIEHRRHHERMIRRRDVPLVGHSVFLDLGYAERTDWVVLEELRNVLRNCLLVLHNGDRIPPHSLLHRVADDVGHLWVVNYLGCHNRITAVPIGLENRWLRRNGRINDFAEDPEFKESERKTRILASFNVQTNLAVRQLALEQLRGNAFADVTAPESPSKYHATVRGYKFVASPPGNGPDCHRTWEALYLGAVPVVLESGFPAGLADLPVLSVRGYDDPVLHDAAGLDALYRSLRSHSSERAYAQYWLRRMTPEGVRDSVCRAPL